MRKFTVTVNNKKYDVVVEEHTADTQTLAASAMSTASHVSPAAHAAPADHTGPAAPTGPAGPTDRVKSAEVGVAPPKQQNEQVAPETVTTLLPEGRIVNSPLTGAVVGIDVSVGDEVKEGQVLVQIEALKLTNEVVSPYVGVVTAVMVKQGQQVSVGNPMVAIAKG